jgi:hypothetical protein
MVKQIYEQFYNFILLQIITMENKNHEVVKLQVKPTNNPLLEITNDVRE